jgi:hypothetical protein
VDNLFLIYNEDSIEHSSSGKFDVADQVNNMIAPVTTSHSFVDRVASIDSKINPHMDI